LAARAASGTVLLGFDGQNPNVRITYTLTADDIVEVNRLHYSRGAPASIRAGMRFAFVIGLVMVVALLANLMFGSSSSLVRSLPYLVFGLFLMSLTTLFIPWSARRAFARDKRLHGEFVAEISDFGINLSCPSSRSEVNWETYIRHFETKNLFVLYQSPQLFNALPKRAFTLEQIEEFRVLLQQKITGS
jgi:hypothetical protein